MKKFIQRFALLFILSLALVFGIYLLAIAKTITLTEPVTVEVPFDGTEAAVNALWQAQVIPSRWAFVVHLLLTGQRGDIQAGTYTFTDTVSIRTIVNIITAPQTYQPELKVTLVEGWTTEQMAQYLEEKDVIAADTFLAAANSDPFIVFGDKSYDWFDERMSTAGLNGFLFPDTYRLFVGETATGIVEKMLNNFAMKLTDQMEQDLAAQNRTLYDAVILASIVGKEVKTPEDKKIAAGIFWKRLDSGGRLESDATINYITKKGETRSTAADLEIESAYNTYRNAGLPPTPISNPGLDSLMAVIYPTETAYWYFLTTPEGEAKFSETYEQHLDYKAQYYD